MKADSTLQPTGVYIYLNVQSCGGLLPFCYTTLLIKHIHSEYWLLLKALFVI